MKFDIFKTRRGKLEQKLKIELFQTINTDETLIDMILKHVDEYEKDNLETIEKLRKEKSVDTKRINGALRQTINAHGPITMLLIGSATKRIHGALIEPTKKKKTLIQKFFNWLK
jgi:hypothetical protein